VKRLPKEVYAALTRGGSLSIGSDPKGFGYRDDRTVVGRYVLQDTFVIINKTTIQKSVAPKKGKKP
jgi:hypothetical protein